MASIVLPPRDYSPLKLILDTQFRTKAKPLPDSLSLSGQTAIVTGSNSGIGLECCRVMLDHGLTRLIMAVRTVSKGEDAAKQLRNAHPDAEVLVWELNMASYTSIKDFTERCARSYHVDIAILNASVLSGQFVRCETGHEESVQVNYLSTTLLAVLLLPILKATKQHPSPGRLTIVSSNAGLTPVFAERDADPILPAFDNPEGFKARNPMERYSTTKLLQLILVHKLSQLVSPNEVIINTVDPGLTAGSSLHQYLSKPERVIFSVLKATMARPVKHAAWIYLDAAVSRGKESHGGFIVNWEIYP